MKKYYVLFIFLTSSLACGSVTPPISGATTQPVNTEPQNVSPIFTPIPTFTAPAPTVPSPTPSLSDNITVVPMTFEDAIAEPPFTSKVTLPALQLEGGNDPRIQAFNELLYSTAQNEAAIFKNDVIANATVPPVTPGSTFELRYTLIGQRGHIWSFKYDIHFYFDGAAHPGSYSIAINYDLQNGRQLSLGDLFIPGSNYLQVLSDYCKAEILKRNPGFDTFLGGADPTPENYARWNLSSEGLFITFDEYQVAPYAAGPQTVTISFDSLRDVANPNGVLLSFENQ